MNSGSGTPLLASPMNMNSLPLAMSTVDTAAPAARSPVQASVVPNVFSPIKAETLAPGVSMAFPQLAPGVSMAVPQLGSNSPPTGAPEPVQTGVLVGGKTLSEPQACVSFGLRALQIINKCQPIIERAAGENADSQSIELLREIDELKRKYCGPVLLRAQSRHRRFSLTNDSKRLLKQWFNEHIEHPYPTQREKEALAKTASLSLKQINDWFTNYRKRHWEADLVDQQCDLANLR